ncbi:unnamed protein product [Diatraea saccharalis]|uniref:Uncharacterized protein n=1 Tax=Diatraea saccharalis TaxID=40085 RepID=A0A9N9WJY2_9NEOP|nr:unnamed protein product [Diatraea saccharalis]
MNLQKYLECVFESLKPEAPFVEERSKCFVALRWGPPEAFQFIGDQLIYRIERYNKMPPWVVEYSGGKMSKIIDNLSPRHPYRFRLRIQLKCSAVPTLADEALKHYDNESLIYDTMKDLVDPSDNKKESNEDVIGGMDTSVVQVNDDTISTDDNKKHKSVKKLGTAKNWLDSQWSDEVWTSTDTDGTSVVCFCMAVRCGYTKQVQVMLEERPALVGILNSSNGFTPLATAVRKGDINMVKFLISAGAELEQRSSTGQTALHLAVLGRHPNIVELLLERGADFKAHDVNGLRVEHYAVDSCDLDMLRLVLDKGGDVKVTDNNGWTPLFRALCQGASTAMVEELMVRGSDPGIQDYAGLPLTSVARLLNNRHGRSRDSVLRLVDSTYPHEKALANFTRLTKKIYNVHTVFK